jgi:hypothetical protein
MRTNLRHLEFSTMNKQAAVNKENIICEKFYEIYALLYGYCVMFRVETKKILLRFLRELAKIFQQSPKYLRNLEEKKNICPIIIKTYKNTPKFKNIRQFEVTKVNYCHV